MQKKVSSNFAKKKNVLLKFCRQRNILCIINVRSSALHHRAYYFHCVNISKGKIKFIWNSIFACDNSVWLQSIFIIASGFYWNDQRRGDFISRIFFFSPKDFPIWVTLETFSGSVLFMQRQSPICSRERDVRNTTLGVADRLKTNWIESGKVSAVIVQIR